MVDKMAGQDIEIGEIVIPADALVFNYIRASGPGG